MGWSSRLALALVCLAGAARADRLADLEKRAAANEAQRGQVARRLEAARGALPSEKAAARERALELHALEGELKRLADERRTVDAERATLYDAEIDRLRSELERDSAKLDGNEARLRLERLIELRRRREQVAAPSSGRQLADLATVTAAAGDGPEALLEKADLVDRFGRGWRLERDDLERRLDRARGELELTRRLAALEEARRRGRLGSSDPFAADVESFALGEREARLATEIAALDRRSKELKGWIEKADQQRAALLSSSARRAP